MPTTEPASPFGDYIRAGNIADSAELYEIENAALDRPGLLWQAMYDAGPWRDRTLLDLGCGNGFWLPRYAADPYPPARLIGVEPDPDLLGAARDRCGDLTVDLLAGSAEHIPLPDSSVDVIHARFAYFWGAGSEAGVAEVRRVLRPGGVLVVIDNDHDHGEFAELLHLLPTSFAQRRQTDIDAWWAAQGASAQLVMSSWTFDSVADLRDVLAMELAGVDIDAWLAQRPPSTAISYGFRLLHLAI